MKPLLLLCVCIAGIAGCMKDNSDLQQGLIGTWELRVSSGTIAGYEHTYPPGNGNTITFLDGSHFKSVYVNADTVAAGGGTYQLSTRSDCDGNPATVISYPPSDFVNAVAVSGDTLHINNYCISDGVFNTYIRIN